LGHNIADDNDLKFKGFPNQVNVKDCIDY